MSGCTRRLFEQAATLGTGADVQRLLVNGLRLAAGRGADPRCDRSQRFVIGYLCFNIVYVALISSLFEIGENNRIRFSIEPLSIVLLGVSIQNMLRVLAAKIGV